MATLNELTAMRTFFLSGATRSFVFRKQQLLNLRDAVKANEQQILNALYTDLKKSPEESWVTENGFLLSEINYSLKHLEQWMRDDPVRTNLLNFPSKSFIVTEPRGVVLIVAPWNYPFQLLLSPLIGAIAAGNCVVLKSSEFAPATSAVVGKIISDAFEPSYIMFKEGEGNVVIPALMKDFIFDHIFYTGSTNVGKIIYQAAAKDLIPVTLELGGKSPVIIESDADIEIAAKRIAVTKFSNAGQMCVAPDYVLIHASKKDAFIESIKACIYSFFGENPFSSKDYGRIINERQFDRIVSYLDNKVVDGGKHDRQSLYISPTIMEVASDHAIMQEEIFGPVLPVLAFNDRSEALAIVLQHKDPLALYMFTASSKNEKYWLQNVAFGGGCINNASWHLTNPALPFGGRGSSGIGSYHGKYSFDTFSHKKGIMKTPVWPDLKIKYPPFAGKLKILKMFIGR